MEWQDLLIDGYGRIFGVLKHVLKGLNADDLSWKPSPDCNTIGWLVWHLTRVQDGHIADLMGEEQLWTKEGWHTRFDRAADPEDSGFGNSPEQVAVFRVPGTQVLLDYHRAVLDRSKNYFATLSKTDLDRELNEPWYQPLPTVGVRLVSILEDSLQHAGQAAFVRGLLQGKGWQKY